ncbi:MAG: small basic protein [Planctomycetota bacterium]|jgi:small basic protein (TIGR04137 family)
MTIDKSLRIKAGSVKLRNVMTRAERLAKLKEQERWQPGGNVLGMPKVRVEKPALKKKKKVKAEGEEAAAGGKKADAKKK